MGGVSLTYIIRNFLKRRLLLSFAKQITCQYLLPTRDARRSKSAIKRDNRKNKKFKN